ncbi:Coiled-coil and C2 domain-containing protein 2A [Irineochytrium annulatum]|nr:Coiled-coil and C2 domain-containing protein 2A [Irineochytrium annulatum]
MKIFYNEKEVTRTIPQRVDPEHFKVAFKGIDAISPLFGDGVQVDGKFRADEVTTFGIRVKEIPESIQMAIYESGYLGERFIGEAFIGIPDSTETVKTLDRQYSTLAFVGPPFSERPTYGSGRREMVETWLSGTLTVRAVWGVDDEGNSLGPPIKFHKSILKAGTSQFSVDPLKSKGPSGILNLRKLMDWITEMKLDPNDPRDAEMIKLRRMVESSAENGITFYEYWMQRGFFRLHLPVNLEMATVGVGAHVMETRRINLLKARYAKHIIVTCPVPIRDEEITEEMYQMVIDPSVDYVAAKQIWSSNLKNITLSIDSIAREVKESSAAEPKRFLKRIRMHQLFLKARQSRPMRVEDVVREERIPEVSPVQSFALTLFKHKRPLKPYRLGMNRRATSHPENGCRITFQISRGYNVPVRRQDVKFDDIAQKAADGPISVRSYIEVSFQNRKVRTAVYEGPNPQWNETLSLEVIAPGNDFSPDKILDSEVGMELIYFNLFDEILVDMIQDERERDNFVHHRRERNWLGCFSLPFTTIYEQTRIEGSFHVETPPILLSYERNPTAGPIENAILQGVSTSETIINLFITMDPPLLQPSPLKLNLHSDEPPEVVRYAAHYAASFPTTRPAITPIVPDLKGHTHLLCRYIRPQSPPPDLPTGRHLLRYVSHIPYVAVRTALAAADALLWCTSDQVLDLGAGDAVEHAILLCNLLLHQELDAVVVLGSGNPEGRTAYVALWEGGEMKLMNAVLGHEYGIKDPHLPLKEAYCVFNQENLESLVYKETTNRQCKELEVKIEHAIALQQSV